MLVVIKIGTSTLMYSSGRLNIRRFEELCKVISDIKNAGNDVVIVSSGAIGMGSGKLGFEKKPTEISVKQACAAVGQCELMYIYDKEFSSHNITVAQVLLTAPDLSCDDRHAKFTSTMRSLIGMGVIPIINENDTVATEEIEFGDNDTLSALVAEAIKADLLVLMSDIDGLYTADPRKDAEAKLIEEVKVIDEKILALGQGTSTGLGTGGMKTKLSAGKIATDAGCDMIITNGDNPKRLYDIMDGKKVGTRFYSKK